MEKLKSFNTWLNELSTVGTEEVDSRQIESRYDKAKFAVKLVRLYDEKKPDRGDVTQRKLLKNISTIADLHHSAFGLYNSGENKKVLGPTATNKIRMIFGANVISQQIDRIPNVVIKKYLPDVDEKEIQPSDIIRVNVAKILSVHGDSLQAILEIASTIVHEATHELEVQINGQTNENGPKRAEVEFMNWVKQNWNTIIQRIPELKIYKAPA